MEAIRKQASKLREQVAKQQQTVLRHLGKDAIFDDEELQCHQKLQDLYNSTRMAKHFQKDIHGIEGFISTSKKQMAIAKKLAEDCCKYGTENQSAGFPLARAALDFGTAHGSIEDRRETMLGILVDQVDAERSYHQKVVAILEELHAEMISEMHLQESLSQSATTERHGYSTWRYCSK